jgi:hypothetical protein
MIQKIDTPVSVIFSKFPRKVFFGGKEYLIEKLGYHHAFKKGSTLFHVFSVASKTLFFRLVLNTENLSWRLEEIGDGESN